MITFLLLILLFIVIEKWGNYFETFLDSDYDYYHNGDLFIDTRNKENVNIGIGNDANDKYAINVGGTLFVKDKLCYGNVCLTEYLLSILNKIPIFFNGKMCLKDSNNKDVCINENHLKILTGEGAIKLKSEKSPVKSKNKNAQYLQSHDTFLHGSNDDNDDYYSNSCRGHGAWCSEWSGRGSVGMMYGVGVDPVDNNSPEFQKFLNACGNGGYSNKKYKWNETKPNENEFYLIPNSAKINAAKYSQFESNYTPKPFSFKCFLPT